MSEIDEALKAMDRKPTHDWWLPLPLPLLDEACEVVVTVVRAPTPTEFDIQPIEGATVYLQAIQFPLYGKHTDALGIATFNVLPKTDVVVRVRSIGFKNFECHRTVDYNGLSVIACLPTDPLQTN